MPDYEIRLFHADGTLAMVQMSHHDSEEEAHSHARRQKKDFARYELHRGADVIRERRK